MVNGLALGSLYGLTALGLVLIFNTIDLVTFAQGEMAMVMAEGLRRAGKNLTRETFLQAMDQMRDYAGSPLPNVSYSPTDHAGVKTAYLQMAKDGKRV